MKLHATTSRRAFLQQAAAVGASLSLPSRVLAMEDMPSRLIPTTGERIPVIGFGSTKAVLEIPTEGAAPIADVLRILQSYGGTVVDTSPRSAEIDREFGGVLQAADQAAPLFVAAKIYVEGEAEGIAQMRQNQEMYGRRTLDLVQVESLRDIDVHWPNVLGWKESGEARYTAATVFLDRDHGALEEFMRRESPDFVHLNYSVAETAAEDRLLPLAMDRGMGVIVNRPFMNGDYFGKTAAVPLPAWAADFDCESWAQFSLKYILAHPAITCVLTETTDPDHMDENIQASLGRLPDPVTRTRMRTLIAEILG